MNSDGVAGEGTSGESDEVPGVLLGVGAVGADTGDAEESDEVPGVLVDCVDVDGERCSGLFRIFFVHPPNRWLLGILVLGGWNRPGPQRSDSSDVIDSADRYRYRSPPTPEIARVEERIETVGGIDNIAGIAPLRSRPIPDS